MSQRRLRRKQATLAARRILKNIPYQEEGSTLTLTSDVFKALKKEINRR